MANLLFLADPNSIHDRKWISSQSGKFNCFVICRKHQFYRFKPSSSDTFQVLGYLPEFSIVRFYRTIYGFLKLLKVVRSREISLIHVMYAEPNMLWALIGYFKSIRIIVTTRGTDILKAIPNTFKGGGWINKVSAWLYRLASGKVNQFTSTSQSQKANVERFFPGEKVELIRTGVDVKQFERIDSEHLPQEVHNKHYVFFPRAMSPIYNHEFSISAIGQLPKQLLEKYAWVFVGANSTYEDYVGQIRSQMVGSDAHFIFLPVQTSEQMKALYANSQLVVMNPHSDGTPVSAMEAMAAGIPLILGPLDYDTPPFHPDMIIKAWDASLLAEKITSLLNGERHSLTQRNFELIVEHGNRIVEMEKLTKIYRRLLSSQP